MNIFVEIIIRHGNLERHRPDDHDEEDHSARENVDGLSRVLLAFLVRREDFGRHVVFGSAESAQHGLFVQRSNGAEVSDFHPELVVEEQIVGLQVSVDHPFGVDVLDALHQLFEIKTAGEFVELASVHQALNQISASCVFQANYVFGVFGFLLESLRGDIVDLFFFSFGERVDEADDVRVL